MRIFQIFVLLNKDKDKYQKRLTVIEGDLQKPNLGLCENERQKLTENVEIVFHAAADVRFDENLKDSIETNVRGTRDIINMAKEMRFLEVLVYVSTAFANCIRHEVDEKCNTFLAFDQTKISRLTLDSSFQAFHGSRLHH